MGFLKNYWQRRVSLTGPESVATLTAIERFFQGGKNWTQGVYHAGDGRKCMVGAVQSTRAAPIEDARYWLRQAIAERHPYWLPVMEIERFNDTHSFAEVAQVIERAKQLAMGAARQSSAPQILPPSSRPALTHQPEQDQGRAVKVTIADLERVAVKRQT
jgi:hypothetical protein